MSSEDVREQAVAYVEAVVARAEGGPLPDTASSLPQRSPAGRLLPGFLKRAVVRLLIQLNRHPYDHLSHPMRVEFEHQIAELRASVHAANRRADQAHNAVSRTRPELDSWRRALQAGMAQMEEELRAIRTRIDELERRG